MSSVGTINSLLVNSNHMDIISNNIANASTMGFKSSTPSFYNITPYSVCSHNSSGSGVGISGISQNFSSGTLIETGGNLDLSITKEGFFRVLDSQGNVHYTRNGQFLLDKERNLISMQGMYLTGQNKYFSNKNSYNTYDLEPINLKHAYTLKAKPTSKITLSAILNPKDNPISEVNSNEDLSGSVNYKTSINIYDKNAKKEKINISFKLKDEHTWIINIQSNNSSPDSINDHFNLEFNSNGQLTSNAHFKIKTKNSQYDNLDLDLTGTIENSNTDKSSNIFLQDGHTEGFLKTFEILPNGKISATYSNEQKKEIGQILLSKFINPEKLRPESGNTWSATENSGEENIGIAGNLGFGILTTKTLEASNVDLNKELINMIVAQRNYQSNAQAFKTEDKIINTLINLK